MKTRTVVLTMLYLLFFIPFFFPLEKVGKIVSISGAVFFDIQGKNIFIRPRAGDILYDQSVIKTGNNGVALITVYGKEVKVPPASLILVSDILAAHDVSRQINETVFNRIIGSLETMLRNNFENIEKRGKGRLETKTAFDSPAPRFLTEKSIQAEFPEKIKQALLAKDYLEILLSLSGTEVSAAADSDARGNYALKALCYFLLGHYPQAAALFVRAGAQTEDEAAGQTPDVQKEIAVLGSLGQNHYEMPELYLLTAGISLYFDSQDERVIPYCKSLLVQATSENIKPYAYYILCLALQRTRAVGEAKKYLEEALRYSQDRLLREEWLGLLNRLPD